MPTDASATPVVLISPAMAVGARYYRPLVEAFEQVGWSAQALGRRGFEPDRDRAGRAHDWSYADEIADIADAIARVRAEEPGRTVLLLGHSLGAQLAIGHQLTHPPADGVIAVAGSVPHFRHYGMRSLALLLMAGVIVPVTTTALGYVPKPVFGGPGARTLMREWSRMVISGQTPFETPHLVAGPALFVSLEGDDLSPVAAVEGLAALYEPEDAQRWHYRRSEAPLGGSTDHIAWVRMPAAVVDHVVDWWSR
ncbi:MAG: alpha/beta hydrolase [Nocardioides sp.]